NWFVGIRTPWTLSSEEVWNKTHKMGSKLFKAAGIIAFFGIIFPVYTVYLVLIPALTSVCWLFVYSYLEYNAETKKKG
ncbi:SdpI family protein, partial [Candidatus Micrarchaeota archaeon]|nr:SdpI family protein [Candidatus Micrarchaeota archaeon]